METENDENDADLQNCDDQLSDPVIPECTLKRAAAMSILQIREEHHVPLSVMTSVQSINQGLFTFALEQIQREIRTELSAAGISNDVIDSAARHLDSNAPFTDVYHGLGTQHHQDIFFEHNLGMVVSFSIILIVMPIIM